MLIDFTVECASLRTVILVYYWMIPLEAGDVEIVSSVVLFSYLLAVVLISIHFANFSNRLVSSFSLRWDVIIIGLAVLDFAFCLNISFNFFHL